MPVREINMRLIVLDDNEFYRHVPEVGLVPLDAKQTTALKQLLGIGAPTIDHVPARSRELAAKDTTKQHKRTKGAVSKGMLETLGLVAASDEPLTQKQVIKEMGIKNGTASSRISQLCSKGLMTWLDAKPPRQYLVTPAGHALLVDSEK